MARKLLIAVLILSLIIELGIAGGIFFAKDLISKQFGVAMNPDTAFLSFIVGWLCIFISLILVLAIYQLMRGDGHYATLCYMMGFFWIAIGIAVYVSFGKPDNLVIDTAKGLLIVILTVWTRRMEPVSRSRS